MKVDGSTWKIGEKPWRELIEGVGTREKMDSEEAEMELYTYWRRCLSGCHRRKASANGSNTSLSHMVHI